MKLPGNIFRNYDIRGIYPSELGESAALHIGKALGTVIIGNGGKRVVVGRDDRESSPVLNEKIIEGLVSTGCDVVDTGITITPAIHFLTVVDQFDLGICVTASHNPKEFNGFRLDYKNARSFYGYDIQDLKNHIAKEDYITGEGSRINEDLNDKYLSFYRDNCNLNKNFKIVVDCGSGATSVLAPKIFQDMGCTVVPVYCNYDSNFPHGVPDPENSLLMHELKEHVIKNHADVGFAYDCDGDRFGMVDAQGNDYATDRSLLLFAEYVLKDNPGATVVYDVKSTALLQDQIASFGGVSKMLRTGHPYFTEEVENSALIGAEFSGHVYFSDKYHGYDDGIYASYRVLEILDRSQKPLHELMAKYPSRSSTNELKVNCPDMKKFTVIEEVKEYLKKNMEFVSINETDGIRVSVTQTGWFLIRASNTSPYLSIRAEGRNDSERDAMLTKVKEALSSVKNAKLVLNFD